MESLFIPPTKSSPSVQLDAGTGILEVKGKSYPENAALFYAPVLEWVAEYLDTRTDRAIRLELEIVYFNSSSSKALLNLFELLDKAAKGGRDVAVNWCYHEANETVRECGEEFKHDLEALPFHLVAMSAEDWTR